MAKELVKLTEYKLFHNHMTVDLVHSIFDMGSKPYCRLVDLYRLEMFEEAAKEQQDLIFTFVYAKPEDDYFIRETMRRVQKHGGKVCFVQIHCRRTALAKRVKHSAREDFGKIRSNKALNRILEKYNLFSRVPFKRSLSIDNTDLPPKKVAQTIRSYYKL